MLRDLIKVAQKLDSLGLTRDANELDDIIRKIASNEDEKAEFAAMQREMREQNMRRQTAKPVAPQLTEAEQVAHDAKRWREQQEMEQEDPEVKLVAQATIEAERFARTKHLLFLTKRKLGPDDEDTKRLQSKLSDQKANLDSTLDMAAKIGKMCRYNVFKAIQEVLTAPIVHREQHSDYKQPEKEEDKQVLFRKRRAEVPDAPATLPRLTPKKASRRGYFGEDDEWSQIQSERLEDYQNFHDNEGRIDAESAARAEMERAKAVLSEPTMKDILAELYLLTERLNKLSPGPKRTIVAARIKELTAKKNELKQSGGIKESTSPTISSREWYLKSRAAPPEEIELNRLKEQRKRERNS